MNMLTQEQLKLFVSYDEETGLFTRKSYCGKYKKYEGNKVTTLDSSGYVALSISGKHYRAHRLVWLYIYGEFPEYDIDHINGCRSDNRLLNLREATRQQNIFNSQKHKDSISGIKGVSRVSGSNTWRARAEIGGKVFHLGSFKTKEEAGIAYQNCVKEKHGEFFQGGAL